MSKIGNWLLSLFLCGLLSCEYDLNKQNFVYLKSPTNIQQFDLSLIPAGDTINIFSTTNLEYNLKTYGHQLVGGKFTVKDRTWGVYSEQGYITLRPNDFSPGYYKLILNMSAKTNSGSLAEFLGSERYLATKEWTIVFDNREAPELPISKSLTPEGYIKISWPKCEQYNFNSYYLSGNNRLGSFTKMICNKNQNYYIDSTYIGGNASYVFYTLVHRDSKSSSNLQDLSFSDSIPELKFEILDVNRLRVFWKKSAYNVYYALSSGGKTEIFKSASDTSCIIDNPGFGARKEFTLYTVSARKPNFTISDYNYFFSSYKTFGMGNYILCNWPNYGYNAIDKVVYSNSYDGIEEYDINSCQNIKNLSVYQLMYQGYYSCPTNSTKVAVLSTDYIYVFNDKSLQSPVKIPFECYGKSIDHFYLTDNDVIAIATPNTYQQIRVADQKVLVTIPLTDYPVASKWAAFSTSSDGRYFSVVTTNGTVLYKISSGKAEKIYSDDRVCTSVLFDPFRPEQFYIAPFKSNILELRRSSDFGLIKSYVMPSMKNILANIDPETGNILTTDYEKLYLLDPSKSKIVFSIRSNDYNPHIYSNKLFGVYGCYLDISKYITQ